MPGIFGVFDASPASSSDQRQLTAILERMSAAMRYEAAYTVDLVSSATLGVHAGRVGFGGTGISQRPADRDPGLVVLTTGETESQASDAIDAEHDVRAIGAGAAVVMRAYQRCGERGIAGITGHVAGLVIDRRRAKCFLFNDRYGMERIFIHTEGSRTFFSSEAKAILAVAPGTRAFNPTALAQFVACGCPIGKPSLYKDIDVLDGGSIVSMSVGKPPVRRSYFDRESLESAESLPAETFLDRFSTSLRAAVDQAISRPPAVGISLTGGLDSRMIMASLDAPAGSVPCYTFGSMYGTTFDVSIGQHVARACGQPHEVIELGTDFLSGFQQSLERSVYISDGYLGFSGAAELYLNRIARTIAPGRVTGNWGGELMRGVRAFKYVMPKGAFIGPQLAQFIAEGRDAFTSTTAQNPVAFALFDQLPSQGYGRYAIERSQVLMRAPFLASDVVKWLCCATADVRGASDCPSAVIRRRPELLTIPTDTGRLGTGAALFRFTRRAYRRAVVKAEYLTSHGAPDWLAAFASRLPSGLLETRFLGRDKFQHFRLWTRTELSAFVRETLTGPAREELAAWFDMRAVAAMTEAHIAGRANYTDELDKLMTVAIAGRVLFDRFR